ncbi:hypothetical protein [Nocardia salmonicida]|uniref:hypothetical protein n=2 Tax=Nocardia salmonicida TaxID=53431 RepID=UPI0037946347
MVWAPSPFDHQESSVMQKTLTVVATTGGAEFYIPGFVKIDAMRQIGRFGHASEYDIVVDDQVLDEVSVVSIGNSSDMPADQFPGNIPLGKAFLGDSPSYAYYTANPAPSWNVEKTVVISGRAWGIEAYIKGFVAIDAIHPRGDWDRLDVVVRYRPNDAALHKITVSTTAPDRELPENGVDLGVVWLDDIARYARYTDEIITSTP